MKRRVELPEGVAGRLDRALADALGVGRAAVKRAFALGEVRVLGRKVRASDPARPGLSIDLELEEPAGPPTPDTALPLRVLFEGERAVVVEKPSGMAVHPLVAGERGTVANAVAARFPECARASPSPREGGAVQRLDKETSGCLTFARDREAWEFLHAALRGPDAEKGYLALAVGRVASDGICSVPLAQRGGRVVPAPDPLLGERLEAKGFRPRPAETRYQVARRFRDHTLLEVDLLTGVMHQIRAHLAHLGHPVAGDALYGGAAASLPGLDRHFLHAARLSLPVPGGGRLLASSPLPPELQAVLVSLPPPD